MGRRTVIGMTFPSFILFCIRATFVFCLTGLDSGLCWASFRPDHAFLSALGYPPFRGRPASMALFGRFWTEKLNYLIKKVFDKMKFILMIYVLNNNYLMCYIDKMKAMKTGD